MDTGVTNRLYGNYRAKVVNNRDASKYGRVLVWIPDLMPELDSRKDGIWARPANNPIGGRNTQADTNDNHYAGSSYIPPMGSWTWVFFESGNINRPYYFGALDIENTRVLPENQLGSSYEKKWTILKTHEGRTIVVSDDPDDARTEITGKKRLLGKSETNTKELEKQLESLEEEFEFYNSLSMPGFRQDAKRIYIEIQAVKDQINAASLAPSNPSGTTSSVYPIDGNQTTILFDERKGTEKILIRTYKGDFLHIDIDERKLQAEFESDIIIKTNGKFQLTATENIDILSTTGDIKVTATGGSIDHKAGSEINQESGADSNIKSGGTFNYQAGGEVNGLAGCNMNMDAVEILEQSGAAGPAKASTAAPAAAPKGERNT